MPLVVLTGLPGTGKSAIADALARRLGLPLLAKDVVEAALSRSGVGREQGSGWAAYEVLVALAEAQLAAGRGAVVDSVAATQALRAALADAAARHGAVLVVVECRCSDEALHRARLDGRRRGLEGWPVLSWADVEDVRGRYEPPEQPDLRLEAAAPFEANVEAAVAAVTRALARSARPRSGSPRRSG